MMARAAQGNGKLSATAEDGKWSVQMCLKAQESVDSGAVMMF
jgi:hypothetical protein